MKDYRLKKIFYISIVFFYNNLVFANNNEINKIYEIIADAIPEKMPKAHNLIINNLRKDPKNIELFAALIHLYLWEIVNKLRDEDNLYICLDLAKHVADLDKNRPLGDYLIAEVLFALGKTNEAFVIHDSAIKNFPVHLDTYNFFARFLADNDSASALIYAQKALDNGTNINELSSAIYTAFLNKWNDKFPDKLLQFTKIYPDKWLLHRIAIHYVENKKFDEALNIFKLAIKEGNTEESRLQLAILLYTEFNKPEEAVKEFTLLINELKNYDNLSNHTLALIYAHYSVALLDIKKYDLAIGSAEKSFLFAINNYELQEHLFLQFSLRKQETLLQKVLEKVNQISTDNYLSYYLTGKIYSIQNNNILAENFFSKAIILQNNIDEFYAARGHIRYKLKNYGEALSDFSEAGNLNPSDASHYYNRACLFAILGNKTEAMANLKLAINLNKTLIETAQKDNDLFALNSDKEYVKQIIELKNNISKTVNK